MTFSRPEGFTKEDALRAALAATAVQLKIPAGLHVVIKACAAMYDAGHKLPRGWRPDVSVEHAQATLAYARKMLDGKAIKEAEYDFVCDKLRRVLLRPLPTRQMEIDDGKARFADSLENLAG